MSRHVDLMDAAGYWREARAVFYFESEGDCIAGAILELVPMARKGDPPGLVIQSREGDVWIVPARQARLVFELKKAQPAVGDRVRITYMGLAKNAAQGMHKAKEFTVEVIRKGSQSQQRTDSETSGEAIASENAVGTGDNSSA